MIRAVIAAAAALGLAAGFAPAARAESPAAAPVAAAPAPVSAPGLSLIGAVLHVDDPARELAFYRDLLGMTLAMTLESGSGTEYMLRFSADPAAAGIILQQPRARAALVHGNAFSRLVLRVPDIDALAARLDAAGHAHEPVRDVAHGYRMMMVDDPQGYRLELVQSAQRR